MINVLFFASLKERLGCDRTRISAIDVDTIDDIKKLLISQNPNWEKWLNKRNLLCSKNLTMTSSNSAVSSGDEVAFFPPVTGG